MNGLFTKRFARPLQTGALPEPAFSPRLRRRLAMVCERHNERVSGEGGYWMWQMDDVVDQDDEIPF